MSLSSDRYVLAAIIFASMLIMVMVLKIHESFKSLKVEKFNSLMLESFENETKLPSVAIVTMTRDPPEIEYWLKHHISKGISKFYVRLEVPTREIVSGEKRDPIVTLLRSYPEVYLHLGTPEDDPGPVQKDDERPGEAQMLRQERWVESAIAMAVEDKIDWLIHIDTDELLDCESSVADAIARDTTDGVHTMTIKNVEAMYPRDRIDSESSKCFEHSDVRDCAVETCASYVNGKGLGRVSPDLHEWGVHGFRYSGSGEDTGKDAEMSSLRLIHYESCDFNAYVDKFLKLSKSETKEFPFPYYNESIAVARDENCKNVLTSYGDSSEDTNKCRDEFAEVYNRYRVR